MPIPSSVRSTYGPQSSYKIPRIPVVPLTITSSAALTDYQVQAVIPYNSDYRSDFADLKFFQGSTSCPYWIEEKTNGVSARVWIRVPTINNGTTNLQIRPDGTTGNSNGSNTFEWFDDFSSGTYGASKWTLNNQTGFSVTSSGLPSGVNHGSFCLRGTNTTGIIWGNTSFTGNFEIHERSYSTATCTNGFTRNGFRATTSDVNQATWLDHLPEACFFRNNTWNFGNNFPDASTPTGGTIRNNWVRSYIKVHNNNATLVIKDSGNRQLSLGPVSAPMSAWQGPNIGLRGDGAFSGQGYDCVWDWLFVKKSAATEPTVTVG